MDKLYMIFKYQKLLSVLNDPKNYPSTTPATYPIICIQTLYSLPSLKAYLKDRVTAESAESSESSESSDTSEQHSSTKMTKTLKNNLDKNITALSHETFTDSAFLVWLLCQDDDSQLTKKLTTTIITKNNEYGRVRTLSSLPKWFAPDFTVIEPAIILIVSIRSDTDLSYLQCKAIQRIGLNINITIENIYQQIDVIFKDVDYWICGFIAKITEETYISLTFINKEWYQNGSLIVKKDISFDVVTLFMERSNNYLV